jgi:hypothetical protein
MGNEKKKKKREKNGEKAIRDDDEKNIKFCFFWILFNLWV